MIMRTKRKGKAGTGSHIYIASLPQEILEPHGGTEDATFAGCSPSIMYTKGV